MRIGDSLPSFSLTGVDDRSHGDQDFADAKVLVVVQMCNHCPYVIGYQDRMNQLARDYADRGVQFVGINSNDATKYPADNFANMKTRANEANIPFPYLFDKSQQVAKEFGSERTPEFFVFDADRKLVYHGRLDDNLEDPDEVEQTYLADAIEAALAGRAPETQQTKAVGCTVKWA